MDKHRVPHVTHVAVNSYADVPEVPGLPGTISITVGSYEDGAEIATYTPRISAFAEGFDPEVHMDPLLTFGIAFGQGSATPGWDRSLDLGWIRNHIVDKVLPDLVPYPNPHNACQPTLLVTAFDGIGFTFFFSTIVSRGM